MPDNGQVERTNRTLKNATVRHYYYESHDQLRVHLGNFLAAYNSARRLKTLRGLTSYEYICKTWAAASVHHWPDTPHFGTEYLGLEALTHR
jgi:hypothetical protein